METNINIQKGTAIYLEQLEDESVDLVVTSPPYPMIEMWDEIFCTQKPQISACLSEGDGRGAFDLMHGVLNRAWAEVHRVLRRGGIACINIGDATRTLNGEFQLYPNHARILTSFQNLGFVVLPDILWRKQTNAPNKFMGSGMLPVGAYVTYEHEYILIFRKGHRRAFTSSQDKEHRRKSAFFWEERNVWFSDVWFDIKGTTQELIDKTTRQRSAAFPFELAYRLICMFSIQGDVVLDPFAGTGTTLAAALALGRNAIGIEFDETFIPIIHSFLRSVTPFTKDYSRKRLLRHIQFVIERSSDVGPLKYRNSYYGFPVVTSQEKELILPEVKSISETSQSQFTIFYQDEPYPDFIRDWSFNEMMNYVKCPQIVTSNNRRRRSRTSTRTVQAELQL